jgi:hypothetical protein
MKDFSECGEKWGREREKEERRKSIGQKIEGRGGFLWGRGVFCDRASLSAQ